MKLEVIGKKENKALQRNEVVLKLGEAIVTPSRKELLPKIAAVLNAKEQLTVIDKVQHPFGGREAIILASVYENSDAMKKIVAKHLIERGTGKKKGEKAKGAEKGGEAEKKSAPGEGKKGAGE